MKIIYYSPHPHLNLMSPSGYGTHMREMITAFQNKGCEVLPVIMGGEDNPPEETININSSRSKQLLKNLLPKRLWRTLKDVNLLRFDQLKAMRRLENTIKEFKPDFIYERCYYLQLSGVKIAKKYNLAHVMEINSPYVNQTNFLENSRSYLEKYARHIERKQLSGTDLPLAVVGPLREYFCERYDIDPDKFLITHDAFNRANIQLNTNNQQKIVKQYGLSGKRVIGYVGSIFEWHGLDKLIRAFDELDIPDTKLLIVGYGEYMVKLTELTKSLNREEDVISTGRVPKEEIFDYITIMDICAAPDAAWYQSPVKIFEYGAMGKPILGPDTTAVCEVMESDKDGILVEPTVEEMMKGLMKLISDPERSNKMGRHFQQKVLNDYTWTENARKVLEAVCNSETQSDDA
jgi:glycosyltransferase involved in cell wall biosynthesis